MARLSLVVSRCPDYSRHHCYLFLVGEGLVNKLVVDIGGTKIRAAHWDGEKLSSLQQIPSPKKSSSEFIMELSAFLRPMLTKSQVENVAIAAAGPIHVRSGRILSAANLGNKDESWNSFNLKEELAAKLQMEVKVDNDAALAALGHYAHVEKAQVVDLVVVTLGTGVGVGAIVDGELVRGGQGFHPEVGHLLLKPKAQQKYPTPFSDHPTAESCLSGHHFARRLSIILGEELNGKEVVRRSQEKDPKLDEHWENYAHQMSVFLTNIYLMYFPEKIVLAGGFARSASTFFLDSTRSELSILLAELEKGGFKQPVLEVSEYPDHLPLFGAGQL